MSFTTFRHKALTPPSAPPAFAGELMVGGLSSPLTAPHSVPKLGSFSRTVTSRSVVCFALVDSLRSEAVSLTVLPSFSLVFL